MGLGLLVGLGGCAYVGHDEYLELWDVDGDLWPVGDDCAPNDPGVYPYAPDRRGDGCDTDCGTEPDQDGDDWPDKADCAPDDPTSYPCAADPLDGADRDCDGLDSARFDACPGLDPDYPDDVEVATCGGAA
ncbi:MAG: hypothetical protein ABMA64_28800 [Myxococcota bacterium]